jgi:SAM-dependent methyltransferase
VDQGAVSGTYTDVDRSGDPVEAAAWMDRVGRYPGFLESKARSRELLGGTGRVLDVGCGLGDEVRASPPGSVGVDPSRTMLVRAAARGGRFVLGAGEHLPVRDGAFAAARADRVLQHVVDPAAVLAELARVVAPGGTVLVIDPDQATLRIEGPDPALARRVEAFRVAGIRHGFLPGQMGGLLEGAGCALVDQERFPIVLTDPADAFGLPGWAAMMHERGVWDAADAAAFDATLAEAVATGAFRYSIELALTRAVRGSVAGGGR